MKADKLGGLSYQVREGFFRAIQKCLEADGVGYLFPFSFASHASRAMRMNAKKKSMSGGMQKRLPKSLLGPLRFSAAASVAKSDRGRGGERRHSFSDCQSVCHHHRPPPSPPLPNGRMGGRGRSTKRERERRKEGKGDTPPLSGDDVSCAAAALLPVESAEGRDRRLRRRPSLFLSPLELRV